MSVRNVVELRCPNCGVKGTAEIWNTINVDVDPQAKEQLFECKVNVFPCNHCGSHSVIPAQLLYHDMSKGFCVQFVPFQRTKDNDFLDSLTDNAQIDLTFNLPKGHVPDYFSNVHFVFSMDELVRYVIFRDRLARRRANIDRGHMVCFSCSNDIEESGVHFCVSRIRQVKSNADESEDSIVGALNSLQLCAQCMTKAAADSIDYPELPFPVLNLEKEGVHRFARWRATGDIESNPAKEGRDSCSLCQGAIQTGDTYTRIELDEESQSTRGIRIEKSHTLAVLCEDCSDRYAVLV
jgi:hypothetical protein